MIRPILRPRDYKIEPNQGKINISGKCNKSSNSRSKEGVRGF